MNSERSEQKRKLLSVEAYKNHWSAAVRGRGAPGAPLPGSASGNLFGCTYKHVHYTNSVLDWDSLVKTPFMYSSFSLIRGFPSIRDVVFLSGIVARALNLSSKTTQVLQLAFFDEYTSINMRTKQANPYK